MLLFRIKSQPALAYKTVTYEKKHVMLFLSLLKMKKLFCHMSLFLCLCGSSLGQYCKKVLPKAGFQKNYKSGRWLYKGIVYRKGGSNLQHTALL